MFDDDEEFESFVAQAERAKRNKQAQIIRETLEVNASARFALADDHHACDYINVREFKGDEDVVVVLRHRDNEDTVKTVKVWKLDTWGQHEAYLRARREEEEREAKWAEEMRLRALQRFAPNLCAVPGLTLDCGDSIVG